MKKSAALLALASVVWVQSTLSLAAHAADDGAPVAFPPKTYCNPLPLPDYQRGRWSYPAIKDVKKWGWLNNRAVDFREMADPSLLYYEEENRWYLIPSAGLLWYSDDLVHWTQRRIEPFDPGYAPTMVQKGDAFYLTACGSDLWRAPHPLGPWTLLGKIRDEHGQLTRWDEPMLFVDDDGSLYCYNGLGREGIYVVKLRDGDPTRWAGPRMHCLAFDPEHR